MKLRIRFPLRHPFNSELAATPVRLAKADCPVLSGSPKELMQAAAEGMHASRAVFVLRFPDDPFLRDDERDALWSAFQVPVYAILLDHQGRLIAYECEAQSGLHIAEERVEEVRPELVDPTPCGCGRAGERIGLPQLLAVVGAATAPQPQP
jgi:hypothetical protein